VEFGCVDARAESLRSVEELDLPASTFGTLILSHGDSIVSIVFTTRGTTRILGMYVEAAFFWAFGGYKSGVALICPSGYRISCGGLMHRGVQRLVRLLCSHDTQVSSGEEGPSELACTAM
jgi:hypothetical protein